MTKYYVKANGDYIGGFDGDDASPPAGAVEVPAPPPDGRQKWSGTEWTALAATVFDADDLAGMNEALAQDGSIVRALGLVLFEEINRLRVQAGLTAYTMTQFKNALFAKMRTRP